MTASLRTTPGRLVFVTDLGAPELEPDDRHHLERVLRLRHGDPLIVSDGRGGWRTARFGPSIEAVGEIEHEPAPQRPVGVGFAPVKGERPEWVVQKLTELGVDHVRPFLATRSVVRWDGDRATRQVQRWRFVAREAAMQCRRVWLPEVHELATFPEVAGLSGAVLADADGAPIGGAESLILVGPEGGWTPEEHAVCPSVVLATHVLRAETAALVAATYLTASRLPRHG